MLLDWKWLPFWSWKNEIRKVVRMMHHRLKTRGHRSSFNFSVKECPPCHPENLTSLGFGHVLFLLATHGFPKNHSPIIIGVTLSIIRAMAKNVKPDPIRFKQGCTVPIASAVNRNRIRFMAGPTDIRWLDKSPMRTLFSRSIAVAEAPMRNCIINGPAMESELFWNEKP
jgi:hypothetical protein